MLNVNFFFLKKYSNKFDFILAHHESSRLKRRVSFDVPELPTPSTKQGAIPLPPSRLLLTPHSKSSLNLSWDHSPSHNRTQPCTYIVELRDPRTYSWSTYVASLPGLFYFYFSILFYFFFDK
jgi:hypothetical protein